MEIKEFQSLVVSQIIESTKELNEKYGKNTIATKEVHSYGEKNKGRDIYLAQMATGCTVLKSK